MATMTTKIAEMVLADEVEGAWVVVAGAAVVVAGAGVGVLPPHGTEAHPVCGQ